MTNISMGRVFPRSSFVGFDRLFNEIEHLANRQEPTYPPHNIVKLEDDRYIVELAVAGFREHELDIDVHQNVLTISGQVEVDEDSPVEYLHKGISARKFKRSFTLSDHVEVKGAKLADGILSVYLQHEVPEEKKPRKIEIGYQAPSMDSLPEFLVESEA